MTWLLVAVVGALAPFIGKPFTVDDTLFLYLGKHLQQNPLDFYNFSVNWYGITMPMWSITMNPPLTGYYIAVMAWIVGWSEVALHLTFLLPAAAAATGTYFLARRLCARPLAASLLGLLTPVFLISSSNLMCDTTMLAFWVWAVWLWLTGLDADKPGRLFASAILIALAAYTKYFGSAIMPLLFAYTLLRRKRLGSWVLFLGIPVLGLIGYQLATQALYGRGLLLDAANYSRQFRSTAPDLNLISQTFTGLMFAGGCLVPALFCAPLIWSRKVIAAGLGLLVAGMISVIATGYQPGFGPLYMENRWTVPVILQVQLLCLGGLSLVGLALADLWRRRDPDSWLLTLWVLGTLVFAAYMNWVNNGRSNLPMAPALGILVMRRLEARGRAAGGLFKGRRLLAVAPGVALALLAAHADYQWSLKDRQAAELVARKVMRPSVRTYFQGHWGFQYYMEKAGAKCLELRGSVLRPGDRLVIPDQHANVYKLPASQEIAVFKQRFSFPVGYFHTMSLDVGAGFYASNIGPLPFVFGRTRPRTYDVWEIVTMIEMDQDMTLP